MNNIILIKKEKNISSFKAINKIKHQLNQKKIGHAGTLDPMAEGLMIGMLNNATKLSDDLMKHDKVYYVEMEFGYETNTFDTEGEIVYTAKKEDFKILNDIDISKYLNKYIGKSKQIPPMFSAIKKNGVKLYELARKGIEIELESRDVEIYYIKDINFKDNKLSFRVKVSSGTYIRSLVRDIGRDLGVFANMTRLVREEIGNFNINMIKDDYLLIEVDEIFNYPKININYKQYFSLKNGMTVIIENLKYSLNTKLYAYYDDRFVGIIEIINIKNNNIYLKRTKYFEVV